jgi:hypothetical protein
MPVIARSTFLRKELKLWRVVVLFLALCSFLFLGTFTIGRVSQPPSWVLQPGMTPDQVRAAMGEPEGVLMDDGKVFWQFHSKEEIQLVFADDRLLYAKVGKRRHPLNERYARQAKDSV